MRRALIEGHISRLIKSLGGVRPPIDQVKLKGLYLRRDWKSIVGFIKISMGFSFPVKIGYVKSGGRQDTIAWILFPERMPPFGTSAFNNMMITLYIRKYLLESRPFEMIVSAIAHEFSHIVLRCINHELKEDEVATDLTAMILGYRDFFRVGYREYRVPKLPANEQPTDLMGVIRELSRDILGERDVDYSVSKIGYLEIEEVNFAADLMDRLCL